jgi:hypothetical protein
MKKKLIKKLKKFSSLDIIALSTILFLTASIYFFLSRKTEYLHITLRLLNNPYSEYSLGTDTPYAWYVEKIKTGKSQKNQLGETLIEIVDVYSYPEPLITNETYVTLKIKAVQNKITKQYLYEGNPILVHDFKSFKVQDLLINGEIIAINQNDPEYKKFKIVLEVLPKDLKEFTNVSDSLIKGVKNYIADQLYEGLIIEDNQNTELVKITKIEKKHGERIIATPNGLVKALDPDRTQVFLHLDLLAEKINDYYFFKKIQSVLVGEQIWLTFDERVSISGIIISIKNE